MSHYFIAQIRIHDPEEYKKYIDEAERIFSKFNGKYLAVDNTPIVLEGKWEYTRTVVIRFPTKSEFENWYKSEEYQKILKIRLSAAQCDTILVAGLE